MDILKNSASLAPEELELDGDTGHEGQDQSGGDQADDGRPRRVLGCTERPQERAQIPDVAGGVLVDQADIGERPFGAALGGQFQ